MPAISNDIIQTSCCMDCAMWSTNRDDSGCANDWNKDLVLRTLRDYDVVVTGNETHFSKAYCAICCDDLAGDRIDVDLIPRF